METSHLSTHPALAVTLSKLHTFLSPGVLVSTVWMTASI